MYIISRYTIGMDLLENRKIIFTSNTHIIMRVIDVYVNLEEKHEQSIVQVDHKLTYHCDVGGCCATVAVLVKFANNEIPDGYIYTYSFYAYSILEIRHVEA